MDILFVRHGKYLKGDDALPLIREAFKIYSGKAETDLAEEKGVLRNCMLPEIERNDKGRLVFVCGGKSAVDLSISHSGDVWMCLMSDERCGVDFQYIRKADTAKLAERYYTAGEQAYSGIESEAGFFDIWVRREALGKYEGSGFFGSYPDTAPDGRLTDIVSFADETAEKCSSVYIHEITKSILTDAGIDIRRYFRAAAVTHSETVPMIQVI